MPLQAFRRKRGDLRRKGSPRFPGFHIGAIFTANGTIGDRSRCGCSNDTACVQGLCKNLNLAGYSNVGNGYGAVRIACQGTCVIACIRVLGTGVSNAIHENVSKSQARNICRAVYVSEKSCKAGSALNVQVAYGLSVSVKRPLELISGGSDRRPIQVLQANA